jgi:integrative and conjugative element protein (TIGR02256 family)
MSLYISSAALATIRDEIADTPPHLETGGILLGTTDPFHVGVAGNAGPGAIQTPTFFLRDLEYTQALAKVEAETSGLHWIGEWHTHPTGPAHPSHTDLSTYARLQALPAGILALGVLSLIVTPFGGSYAITAWICVDGTGTQLRMEQQ